MDDKSTQPTVDAYRVFKHTLHMKLREGIDPKVLERFLMEQLKNDKVNVEWQKVTDQDIQIFEKQLVKLDTADVLSLRSLLDNSVEATVIRHSPPVTRPWFRFVELVPHILPTRVRMEAFEPAYHDEKADYLKSRQTYKSKTARRWLTFCFVFHVGLMVVQCGWGMCCDKVKRLLLSFLPEYFRRYLS